MSYKLYLDESGDLGWSFHLPNRNGGSSRFLTIAYIIIPSGLEKKCSRLVKSIYDLLKVKYGIELKATGMKDSEKELVAGKIIRLLNDNPDFILGAITVKKENVVPHMRDDCNLLYNYMMGLVIPNHISTFDEVDIISDKRSVKVKSGNTCIEYLRIKVAYELNSPTLLIDSPTESHTDYNLMFIDWVANFIWSNFEDQKEIPYFRLLPRLHHHRLFFNP
jgi:hypothetical protein